MAVRVNPTRGEIFATLVTLQKEKYNIKKHRFLLSMKTTIKHSNNETPLICLISAVFGNNRV